jgi:dienelactone hydrolase
MVLRDWLVIRLGGRPGRAAVHVDALESQIVAGPWAAPKAGDTVTLPDGSPRTWEAATVGEDGWLNHPALAGGYAYTSVSAEASQVMLLEAVAHSMVYVNGEPRVGDPYQTGIVRLPMLLRPGTNGFLFHCGRGRVKARLVAPQSPALLHVGDATLPDLIVGEKVQTWGAVVVLNATPQALGNLSLAASSAHGATTRTHLPTVPPLSLRKVGFPLKGPAPKAEGPCQVELWLMGKEGGRRQTLDTATLDLRVRQPQQTHKRTFLSQIDGSVQYYAVNPRQPVEKPTAHPSLVTRHSSLPALFLTLHGAGVEAIGQADAYEGKTWGHLVAPTNRRPFGFDWEDWGRLDALEVLETAQRELHTDPSRTYLTGHSMGGHGVWHLGATFPDRFAAIGPSAGWISFWSYAGTRRDENPTAVQRMLQRATAPSDTLALVRNHAQHGVYILHGAVDDNVPVAQAQAMNQHLSGFHRDFLYHEQPDAGHWWDASDEPGTDCVDWAPMFDFFARHALPSDESVRQVDFTTASPGVSAWSHWACIEAQIHPLQPSSVQVRCDPGQRRFVGTTDNVARLSFNLRHIPPGGPIQVELDGQKMENMAWPTGIRQIWLAREGEKWSPTAEPSPSLKGPHRYGPFKEAFRYRMLFVYGTQGSPEENAWAFAKARYDAEQFWYRGNGSVDVIPDVEFNASADRDRSVILYGNAETHAAWDVLLADSPVQVRRGSIRIGPREVAKQEEGLACLFLRPRPGSDQSVVGVVAGSGLAGMRLTDRLAYFVSGVGYPDCLVLGPEVLTQGSASVRVAGFFGMDWSVESGEFAWRE